MKRIILLLVTLMSFSAKADIELLWKQQIDGELKTTVYANCVFADSTIDKGIIYLYTYSYQGMELGLISVEPLIDPYLKYTKVCDRKTKVED